MIREKNDENKNNLFLNDKEMKNKTSKSILKVQNKPFISNIFPLNILWECYHTVHEKSQRKKAVANIVVVSIFDPRYVTCINSFVL